MVSEVVGRKTVVFMINNTRIFKFTDIINIVFVLEELEELHIQVCLIFQNKSNTQLLKSNLIVQIYYDPSNEQNETECMSFKIVGIVITLFI